MLRWRSQRCRQSPAAARPLCNAEAFRILPCLAAARLAWTVPEQRAMASAHVRAPFQPTGDRAAGGLPGRPAGAGDAVVDAVDGGLWRKPLPRRPRGRSGATPRRARPELSLLCRLRPSMPRAGTRGQRCQAPSNAAIRRCRRACAGGCRYGAAARRSSRSNATRPAGADSDSILIVTSKFNSRPDPRSR